MNTRSFRTPNLAILALVAITNALLPQPALATAGQGGKGGPAVSRGLPPLTPEGNSPADSVSGTRKENTPTGAEKLPVLSGVPGKPESKGTVAAPPLPKVPLAAAVRQYSEHLEQAIDLVHFRNQSRGEKKLGGELQRLLGAKETELRLAAGLLEEKFAQIRTGILKAGRPEALLKFDGFLADFRKGDSELRQDIRILAQPATSQNLDQAADRLLSRLKAGSVGSQPPPIPPLLLDPEQWKSPWDPIDFHTQPPAMMSTVTPAYLGGTGEKGRGDLDETPEVQITPEIQALADDLGGSPMRIYEWVRNNTEFEPYFGSLKGSQAALETRAGNDYDLASLTLALLRASNIPSRYVRGTVKTPVSRAESWLGVRHPDAVNQVLNTAGIDAVGVDVGSDGTVDYFQIDRVWVEALVPHANYRGVESSSGSAVWVPLDPAFKLHRFQPGISGIPDLVSFDENGYLASRTSLLAYEWYQNQVRSWLQTNRPGQELADVPYTGTVTEESLGLLPASLPHEAMAFTGEWSELPETLRHRYQITLLRGGTSVLNRTLRAVETSLSRVTLSYQASKESAALVDALGGLEETPAFLASLTPVLKIDGIVDTSGSTVNTGDWIDIRVRLLFPNDDPVEEMTHYSRVAGDYHALVLDFFQASETLLDRKAQILLEANSHVGTPQEDKDALEGELLSLTGMRYWQRLQQGTDAVAGLFQFKTVKQLFEVLASGNTTVLYLFDRPFAVTPGNLGVDAKREATGQVNIDGDPSNSTALFQLVGRNSSAQEHAVWEEIVHADSISTIKSLQFANETDLNSDGTPNHGDVLDLTVPGQTSLLCPGFPSGAKSSMESALGAGKVVKTPICHFVYNQWHGVGWLEEDPVTGAGAYLIAGYLAGGETTQAHFNRGSLKPVSIPRALGRNLMSCAEAQGIPKGLFGWGDDPSELVRRGVPVLVASSIQANLKPGETARLTLGNVDCLQRQGIVVLIEGPEGGGSRYLLYPAQAGGSVTCDPPDSCPPLPDYGETGDPRDPCAQSGDPVNFSNGNLVEKEKDLRIPLPGPDLEVVRTYNSLRKESGPLGPGWTHNYNIYLVEDPGVTVTAVDEDGGVNIFLDNGDGTYQSPPGLHETLTTRTGGWTLRKRDGQRQLYDTAGRITSLQDRNGNTLHFTYDGLGRLHTVEGLTGRQITFGYDTADRVTTITDSASRVWTYAYDPEGRLQSVTTPSDLNTPAQVTSYTYYEAPYIQGNLGTIVRADGSEWHYSYYMNGKIFQTIEPEGRITTLTYLPIRRQARVTNGAGNEWVHQYDDLGRLVRQEDPLGNVVTTEWNPEGYRQNYNDAGGTATIYSHDAEGNVLSIQDPEGGLTSYTYEPEYDLITSLTNPRTATTTFNRDPVTGDLFQIVDVNSNKTTYTYNSRGQVLTITDPENRLTTMTYDPNGYLATVTDAAGGLSTYTYDALGRLLEVQPPVGGPTQYQYDVLDRVRRVEDPSENLTLYQYDSRDRLTRIEAPGSVVRQYTYDGLGRLISEIDPLGGETRYEWSPMDCGCSGQRPTALVLPDGSRWEYDYDPLGRLVLERDPLGREIHSTYDARGYLRSRTAGTETVSYEHDALGRLVRRLHPDATEDSFSYDPTGNLLTAANPNVTLTFEYDLLNRMTARTDSRLGGKTITYEYDKTGLRSRMVDPEGGETLYDHDTGGRLETLRDPLLRTYTFQYDAGSRRTATLLPEGGRIDYGYDTASRLTSTTHRDGTGTALLGFQVSYDERSNPVTLTDPFGVHDMTYDLSGRLLSAVHPNLTDEWFSYDAVDNRSEDMSGRLFVYDEAQQLLAAGSASHVYDAWGRRATTRDATGTTRYSYDGEGRLDRIELPDARVISYAYDPLGNRIGVDVDGTATLMVYDDLGISTRYTGAGVLLDRLVQGLRVDLPLGLHRGGEAFDFRLDPFGSVAALTDSVHAIRARLLYGAFGNIVNLSGDQDPIYSFTGREWDSEAGLYFYRARFYEPTTGRFMSTDPLGFLGGRNPYVYALNSPLRFTDPTGEIIPLIVAGILVGMAVGWGSYAVATVATGGEITLKGSLGALAAGGIAGGVGVVAAPIAGAIGLGSGALGTFLVNGAAGAAGYMASYGIEYAFDPCTKFSWLGLGASGFFGGVGGYLGNRFFPTRGMSSFNQAPYFFPRTWHGVIPGYAGPNAINSIYLGGGASVAIGAVGPTVLIQAADKP